MKQFLFLCACGLVLFVAGCSDQPAATAKKEEKVQPITGQTALYRMYQVARSWAPDAEVVTMKSIHLTEVPAVRGEAGAWEVMFLSPAKGTQRGYTYSVIESAGNLHQGVFPGPEEAASGAAKAFLIGAVKIDSNTAFKTALTQAADYNKKNAAQTISFELGRQPAVSQNPVWRVIWGESAATSSESVLVDATSGDYLETLH